MERVSDQMGIMTAGDIVEDPCLRNVLDTSARARQQSMNLVDLAEANAISVSQSPSLDVQLEFSKQQKLLYSYLAELRGLNRNAINGVRNTKQVTAEARQEIDRLHLHLQNLYYEERHLRGEIAACESYEYVRLDALSQSPILSVKIFDGLVSKATDRILATRTNNYLSSQSRNSLKSIPSTPRKMRRA